MDLVKRNENKSLSMMYQWNVAIVGKILSPMIQSKEKETKPIGCN